MKVALFLIGVLLKRYTADAKHSETLDKRWRAELHDFEDLIGSDLDERTVEQWEELVRLTGECYYAMAVYSHDQSTRIELQNLYDAIKEINGT